MTERPSLVNIRRIFSAVYPPVMAVLAALLFFDKTSTAAAIIISLFLAAAPFLGERKTFFVPLFFMPFVAFGAKRSIPALGIILLSALAFSFIAFEARLLSDRDFRRNARKKGLLFWGVAFFALALPLGGIVFPPFRLWELLIGALAGALLLLVYHTAMALGDVVDYSLKSLFLLGFSALALGYSGETVFLLIAPLCVIPALWLAYKGRWGIIPYISAVAFSVVHPLMLILCPALIGAVVANRWLSSIPKRRRVSTKLTPLIALGILAVVLELVFACLGPWGLLPLFLKLLCNGVFGYLNLDWQALLSAPVFGIGFGALPKLAANAFLWVMFSMGAFGLLALLTNLKHVLELIIRRFTFEKFLLTSSALMALLFVPVAGGVHAIFIMLFYIVLLSFAEVIFEEDRNRQIDNVTPIPENRPPRVVFTFIEAGKGHITPTRAVCDVFKEKYGDRTEVVESYFYSETGNEDLRRIENLFASAVKTQNKNGILSILCRIGNFLAGDTFALFVLMAMTKSGRRSRPVAEAHLKELDADIIFTAHWAIPFYISKQKTPHPYTVMFCPDVQSNGVFNIDCNRFLMPMKQGFDKVDGVRMYAGGRISKVPFPIRNEAFGYLGKRDELRRKYKIAENAFTVTLCDGGYGMANMEKTIDCLCRSDAKMTLVALCGTNTALYERLAARKMPENITLLPVSFTDKALEYVAMSDLFVGKSGANSMAEPAFFGVPIIVTKCITYIERHIKDHYVHRLGGALYIKSPRRAAKKIASFANDPQKLDSFRKALEPFREDCGAEAMADMLCESIR